MYRIIVNDKYLDFMLKSKIVNKNLAIDTTNFLPPRTLHNSFLAYFRNQK